MSFSPFVTRLIDGPSWLARCLGQDRAAHGVHLLDVIAMWRGLWRSLLADMDGVGYWQPLRRLASTMLCAICVIPGVIAQSCCGASSPVMLGPVRGSRWL